MRGEKTGDDQDFDDQSHERVRTPEVQATVSEEEHAFINVSERVPAQSPRYAPQTPMH